jgi:hypothetical protein
MHWVSILAVTLLFTSQKPEPAAQVGLVAVGQISKIDKAKRSFQIRTTHDAKNRAGRPRDDGLGDIRIGVSIGGGRVQDRFPQPIDPRFPPADPPFGTSRDDSTSTVTVTTTDVFLTDATSCKDGTKVILCEDLKATDNVRVTGNERREPRGKGLYATEVVRTR